MARSEMHPFPSPELLLRHDAWLRALIRRLVDGDAADDVAQEVWQQAAARRSDDPLPWPQWLATVARRLAFRSRRTAARRQRREAAVARSELALDVDPRALAEQVEQRQQVAAAVLALDEPFRTVVLMRWFEDLEPGVIAERLGIPAATVRTRLHRAHEQLRLRFERERGSRWRAELALLCVPLPQRAMSWSLRARFAVVAAAMLPLVTALVWWLDNRALSAPASGAVAAVTAPATGLPVGASAPDAVRRESETVSPPAGERAPLPPVRIAGFVRNPLGEPLANVPIDWAPIHGESSRERLAASDRDGAFAFELPPKYAHGGGKLVVAGDWWTLRSWQPGHLDVADDALIVAAPRIALQGRVVDADGAPVAEASVQCLGEVLCTFAHAGTVYEELPDAVRTDAAGWFVLSEAPGTSRVDLAVDYTRVRRPMPEQSTDALVLVVPRQRPLRPSAKVVEPVLRKITGFVRDPAGAPIADAVVFPVGSMGGSVKSAANGEFAVEPWFLRPRETAAAAVQIAFSAAGRRSEVLVVDRWDASGQARLDAVLHAGDRTITGRVVDAKGKPIAGLTVRLADPTPMEAGSLVRNALVENGPNDTEGPIATTADDGGFVLGNLLDRDYRLRLVNLASTAAVTTEPVRPGVPAELVFAPGSQRDVRLRVVDDRKSPIEGVRVHAMVVRLRVALGGGESTGYFDGQWDGVTDSRGEVVMSRLPGGEFEVRLKAPGHEERSLEIAAGSEREFEFVLARQCNFRVEVGDLEPAENAAYLDVRFFDAAGQQLRRLRPWRGTRLPDAWGFAVRWGRSDVGGVAATAVRAELLRDGKVLRSMPVQLDPAQTNVLTFPR